MSNDAHSNLAESQNARLSRLLWDAREGLEMWADTVEAQTQKRDTPTRSTIEEIDTFRDEQGWSPNGFGGEE